MHHRNERCSRPTLAAVSVLLLLLAAAGACQRAQEEPGPETDLAAAKSAAAPADMHPGLQAAAQALAAQDLPGARDHLESVPPGDPSYPSALANLLTVYASLGEMEAVAESYAKLAAVRTGDPQLFLGMGWAQYRLGRFAEAEVSALRAIELSAEDPEPRYNVAFFRLAQGRLSEAIEAYHRAMKLDFEMGFVYEARGHLVLLKEQRPDFADVHYALAYFANSLGDRSEEMNQLERYLAMDPQGPAVEVARTRLTEARDKIVTSP